MQASDTPKRECYDYSKVNWANVHRELVPWETIVDCMEPEIAWHNFTKVLFSITDKHIQKLSLGMSIIRLGLIVSVIKNVNRKKSCIKNLKIINLLQ